MYGQLRTEALLLARSLVFGVTTFLSCFAGKLALSTLAFNPWAQLSIARSALLYGPFVAVLLARVGFYAFAISGAFGSNVASDLHHVFKSFLSTHLVWACLFLGVQVWMARTQVYSPVYAAVAGYAFLKMFVTDKYVSDAIVSKTEEGNAHRFNAGLGGSFRRRDNRYRRD